MRQSQLIFEAPPILVVYRSSQRLGPLSAQETTRRVLVVEGDKQLRLVWLSDHAHKVCLIIRLFVVFVVEARDDVRLEVQGSVQNLTEALDVHRLSKVAVHEIVSAFRVRTLQQVLELLERGHTAHLLLRHFSALADYLFDV